MFVKVLTAAAILIAIAVVVGFGWEALQCYHAHSREARVGEINTKLEYRNPK